MCIAKNGDGLLSADTKSVTEIVVCDADQSRLKSGVSTYSSPDTRPFPPLGVEVPSPRLLGIPEDNVEAEQLRVREDRWVGPVELVKHMKRLLRSSARVSCEL